MMYMDKKLFRGNLKKYIELAIRDRSKNDLSSLLLVPMQD